MNENKGIRLWQWAVVLLVLCNMGLIATIWLRPHYDWRPPGGTPRDFVVHSLHFSDEQTSRYDVMVKAHQQAMRRLRLEGMEYRQTLFADLKNAASGRKTADSLSQLIANVQKQIEIVTYDHFAQVRALCTEAQKPEFDKIIGDVTKMMNGGPGGHRPPPPGDGPPEGPPPAGDREGPPPQPDAAQNH